MTRFLTFATVIAATCASFACDREQPNAVDPSPPVQTPVQEQQQEQRHEQAAANTPPAQLLEDPGAEDATPITEAVAVLQPTEGNKVAGTVTLTAREGAEGLEVKADVRGLPPGKHAYHVHQFGNCSSDDGKAAGTHFNFSGSSENPGENIDRITGNLGELEAGKDGTATHTATIDRAALQGQYSILGRSIIVHERGNDPKSPPMGDAGGRLACGVIGVADADASSKSATAPTRKPGMGG